jgi:glutamyl-Q tRNA(Asp) synthetase
METVTRFAPSPSGLLHLGHAYSALFAASAAQSAGGRFLLRIEDIDTPRCRPEFEDAIDADLAWLGLSWETPVRRQSDHFDDYRAALATLEAQRLLYPCFCTRKEIQAEIAAAASAPHGPDGPLYPGTCRNLSAARRRARKTAGDAFALRLDMEKALAVAGPLSFSDLDAGEVRARPAIFGDPVLARKDIPASYHLAATLDDHLQGVTLVTRGDDLRPAAHLHRLLQALLGLAPVAYRHHRLLTDETGRRFAKRDRARTLQALREAGHTSAEVIVMTGINTNGP